MSTALQPVLIAGIVMSMVSCSKTASKPSSGSTTPGGGTPAKTTDVYVCGSDNGKPCYWKNDTEVTLAAEQSGQALSIAVNGTDVYVCGFIGTGPVYWKNGNATSLEPRTTAGIPASGIYVATGIAFADSNFYVAVDQRVENNSVAKSDSYEKIQPSGFSTEYGVNDQLNGPTLNSIFVSGTDVYCAGSGIQGTGIENNMNLVNAFASYYKNGGEYFLSQAPNLNPVEDYVYGQATGIAVSGSDVYVVGWQAPGQLNTGINDNYPYPIYWKNNAPQALQGPNGGVSGIATSISLSGSDVYISGYADMNDEFDNAVYWKNGEMTVCGNSPSLGESIGEAPNGDVYVAGYQYDINSGAGTAVLWKNGGATVLGAAGNSMANGVFVYIH